MSYEPITTTVERDFTNKFNAEHMHPQTMRKVPFLAAGEKS